MRRLRVALVGAPNVGKSALFNRLTGVYVHVSNYPGTSVELTRGRGTFEGRPVEVVDTPGMYALVASSEEERVAQEIVLEGGADVLVHVVDAKALARMLPLTLQLLEGGRRLVLAVNMMDEADRLGIRIDARALTARLGIPVVPVSAIEGRGLAHLVSAIVDQADGDPYTPAPVYTNELGEIVAELRGRLHGEYAVDPTLLVSLLLQRDPTTAALLARSEPDGGEDILAAVEAARDRLHGPALYRMAYERQRTAHALLDEVLSVPERRAAPWGERLGRLLAQPVVGGVFLALVLYVGLYEFVGVFGAGKLVDWIEGPIFEQRVNPWLERFFMGIPWPSVRSLYVGEYGMLTLGVRYAVAIVLPIVGAFFFLFSVLEDSGYFPRLALLVDRIFKRIGLSGRAVIPMVLGFACDTMATMVTRTLETRRERVLSTLLLALAIPCSAQLGVMLAILSGQPAALGVWAGALLATFLLVGAISARVIPGAPPVFHMELPPLRRPRLGNVLLKTATRMQWYFLEVLPLFLLASVLLWAGQLTGALDWTLAALRPVVGLLGLPPAAASVFLLGFFRRDYGAAGLYALNAAGALDVVQLTVAAVTLTLFVPCVAQFLMMIRERGWKTALGMLAFITPFAFTAGFVLNLALRGLGW